ncbi:MAG: ROK family protein [Bacteroidetes bacterium]|nr:ROK family protein [Bacteroidota bacterium]MCH8245846.1 ROK family protein [Bacteroidota bacterium]
MTILGIDIGGSGIKGAPVDVDSGRMLSERYRIPTPEPATPDAVADIVAKIVDEFDCVGPFGCTVPARVENGVVYTAVNIHEEWINCKIDDLLFKRTGRLVEVLNDADAAGIASLKFGAGANCEGVVLFLTIGTGIGSALFVNGVLVPNTELGHLSLHGEIADDYASARARMENDLTWPEWSVRFQEYLERVEFLMTLDWIIIGGGASHPEKTEQYLHLLKTRAGLRAETLGNEAGIIGAAFNAKHLVVERELRTL